MQYRTGPLQHTPTVVKNLVIINAIVFGVMLIGDGRFLGMDMTETLGLHYIGSPAFEPWQLITHMFMHGGLSHIFMNMFGLFMIGSPLEYHWGSKRFLNFYLICGLGGAALNIGVQAWEYEQLAQWLSVDQIEQVREHGRAALVDLVMGGEGFRNEAMNQMAGILHTPMVGASGAIFGILAAFGILYPNVELMIIFFPVPIKAKWFVLLYGAYEFYAGYAGLMGTGSDNVAHFAHIGGGLAGVALALLWRRKLSPW